MNIFQLNERFCQNENQSANEMVSYYEPMISYVASYAPGNQFVVLTVTYSRDVPMNLLCNSLQKFLNHQKHTMDVGFVQLINHPNLLD
uniref:DUF1330 domain-containing protein n=1 Tax=Globodera pallida TaxID=36090 RepID=A0A183CIV6_GLOPA